MSFPFLICCWCWPCTSSCVTHEIKLTHTCSRTFSKQNAHAHAPSGTACQAGHTAHIEQTRCFLLNSTGACMLHPLLAGSIYTRTPHAPHTATCSCPLTHTASMHCPGRPSSRPPTAAHSCSLVPGAVAAEACMQRRAGVSCSMSNLTAALTAAAAAASLKSHCPLQSYDDKRGVGTLKDTTVNVARKFIPLRREEKRVN